MLQSLNYPLNHIIRPRPLWCGVLAYNPIILTQLIEFYCPFINIVNENVLWYTKLTNDFIFSEPCNSFCIMVNKCLGLTPLKIVVNCH